ncbi:hypothetical protein [Streptomyces sp. NPDC049040]|uniref:hypothetical protein n=1 Tax=Streptomyces sp. NPDC049040 TaxID=3365593 RepID=UPI003718F18D
MTLTTRRGALTASVLTAGLLLAVSGCGASGSSDSAGSSSASSSSGSSAGGAGTVHTVTDATLGSILVNGKGFTLYRFDKDTDNPPASHCAGTCAALWPAAPAADAASVKGVDPALVGSITGAGGVKQLTIGGWPMYTYSADSKAGDTGGQGVMGIWWAVTPTGGKAAATAPASGSDGY